MNSIKKVKEYIKKNNFIQEHFNSEMPNIHKIDDGKLNNLYLLNLDERSFPALLLKHFPEFIRVAKEQLPMPKHRADIEYKAIQLFKEATPRYVPTPYFFDQKQQLIFVEFIENAKKFETLLKNRENLKLAFSFLGDFITQNVNVNVNNREILNEYFVNNEMQHYIFKTLFIIAPHILEQSQNLKKNFLFLEERFFSQETLLHGNLQQSSLLVKNNSIFVVDYESAFVGPIGFDVGRFLSSILIDILFYSKVDSLYTSHILATTSEFLEKIVRKTKAPKELFFSDAFGFGALYILQHAGYLKIQNSVPKPFSDALLNLGFTLLENLNEIQGMEDFSKILPKII